MQFIHDEINKLSILLTHIQKDQKLIATVDSVANTCIDALQNGHKILFAGNGGSAADSQHLAAELVSRYRFNRPGLAALALTTDTSSLTAIGNDYAFEHIFARQIESIGTPGDIFIGISTSGKSPNILRALEAARAKKIITVGFTGHTAPLMTERCDYVLNIPSTETAKIQECHILLGHIVCALIENKLFGETHDPLRLPLQEINVATINVLKTTTVIEEIIKVHEHN